MSQFDRESFFREIATQLRDKGALTRYETPEGTARPRERISPDRPFHRHPEQHTAGQSHRIGDVPYEGIAHRRISESEEYPLTQEEINVKRGSLMRTMLYYMPADKMNDYIRHFTQNMQSSATYRLEVEEILQKLTSGIKPTEKRLSLLETYQLLDHPNPAFIAIQLPKSEVCAALKNHPEISLAIATFIAAQCSYIHELEDAIDALEEEGSISAEEAHGAHYALAQMEEAFMGSPTYDFLAPLVGLKLTENRHLPAGEAVQTSIKAAWEEMFSRSMFNMQLMPDGNLPKAEQTDNALQMQCPAKIQLQKFLKSDTVTSIYDTIAASPSAYRPLLEKAQALTNALNGDEPARVNAR